MRLVGTLSDERQALAFSQFLQKKGVSHQIEVQTNTDWGSSSYGTSDYQIWITDEDQVKQVLKWFQEFTSSPQDPAFHPSPPSAWLKADSPFPPPIPPQDSSPLTSWDKQPMGWMTQTLLVLCCSLFILSHLWTTTHVPNRYAGLILFSSPIEKAFLYDYPKFYQLINHFIHLYGYEELEDSQDLSLEGKELLQQIHQTPFWPGVYHLLLKGGLPNVIQGLKKYPTFEKIREGELWRFFTPCLLHGDLFHIFFNMLWLIVLGKQIEQRLKPWRYAIFILAIGVFSNTAQYLTSGPNFIGFSGILCGMLAFIWVRQRQTAWEGYQVDRLTLLFILVFILGMALLQVIAFFLEKSFALALSPNIANIAHLTGGLAGLLFGRLNFFSWRQA